LKKILAVFLSIAALAVALVFASTSSAIQFSGVNGQLTYTLLNAQTANRSFYSVNSDGTGSTTVIPATGGWVRAVFSPDNSKVAQVTTAPSAGITVQNPDLTGAVNVVSVSGGIIITDVFFNRESTGIYYIKVGSGSPEIRFVNIDGTGDTLVSTFASGQSPVSANISPDGTNFVISIVNSGNSSIVLRPVAGGADTTIASLGGASASLMSFSPDGSKILFSRVPPSSTTTYELVSINVDGTGLTTIASVTNEQFFGIWSPDGTKLAYIRRPSVNSQNNEIYVANADGSNPVLVVGPSAVGDIYSLVNWRLSGGPSPSGPTTTIPSGPVTPAFTG